MLAPLAKIKDEKTPTCHGEVGVKKLITTALILTLPCRFRFQLTFYTWLFVKFAFTVFLQSSVA
ncbi:hypothetical protein FC58_GL000118 [Limosilactobacillus vaginalis DSM 5837 = ATCC 49540]|nr:hypothetical protein FC58_GL000118 [Limosilactobacillus vaginalis DSM 5837 = ATCC 49540]